MVLVVLSALAALPASAGRASGSAETSQQTRQAGPPEGGCIIEVIPVVFGSYDVNSPAPLDSYSTLTFNCSPIPGEGRVPHVRIEIGAGSSGMIGQRRMQGPGGFVNYNLYLDAVRQVIWGDGSQGSQTFELDSPQPNQDHVVPIYGRVPPMQAVSQGHYDDALTVTILF